MYSPLLLFFTPENLPRAEGGLLGRSHVNKLHLISFESMQVQYYRCFQWISSAKHFLFTEGYKIGGSCDKIPKNVFGDLHILWISNLMVKLSNK